MSVCAEQTSNYSMVA
jgi:proteasome assembly chaperone (PAC2) family protein